MNRINTQLPQVPVPQPPKTDWFSRHHLWGYAFLLLAFFLAIAFIYQMQYGRTPSENQICIQVITPARNLQTGEIKEFPTPCDVPEGWEPLPPQTGEAPLPAPDSSSGGNDVDLCVQVVVSARHRQTGEIRQFPTPCHVTEEWETI